MQIEEKPCVTISVLLTRSLLALLDLSGVIQGSSKLITMLAIRSHALGW